MGSLKPGATYIYERANGTVYCRESGSDPGTRVAVGWDYDSRTADGRPLRDHIKESKLWAQIFQAAETDEAIQECLERAKILYLLKQTNE